MKTLLAALILLSPSALAAKPLALHCATPQPTTTFNLSEQNGEYLLEVKHVNGVAFMPIHEGVIVPHDFPYLEGKANFLTKMGVNPTFRFPKDKCKVYGQGQLSCASGERKTFGDVEMQALNFYTGKVHEQTLGLSLDSWKVTLSIWSPDFAPVADVTMVYGDTDCNFSGF
jgi:hypothetical protein